MAIIHQLSIIMTILPLVLLAAGGLSLFAVKGKKQVSAVDKMTVEISNVKFKSLTKGVLNLDVYLESTNPTTTTVTADYVYMEVVAGGAKLATLQQARTITIPGQKTTTYRLPLQMSLKKITLNAPYEVLEMLKNVKNKKMPFDKVQIKGYIRSNGILFPYDDTLTLVDNTVSTQQDTQTQTNTKTKKQTDTKAKKQKTKTESGNS